MPYTIYKSDGTSVAIPDNAIDNVYYNATGGNTGTGLGIQLIGRNALNYGGPIAQAFLQLTENFASGTAFFPSDATALQGQLWFEKTSGTAGNLYLRHSGALSGGMANWSQVMIATGGNLTVSGSVSATTFNGALNGNATSATSSTTSTNLAGGAAGSVPYQSAANTTTMLAAGTNGHVLTLAAGLPTWAAASGSGVTIADDTATVATYYPTFATATSGSLSTLKVSSTKLTFDPSTGTMSATIFNSLSDRRAKTNIRSLGYGLDEVLKMVGHKYEMIDGNKTSIGLIAQDVQYIVPEVVIPNVDGMFGINYAALSVVLIEAIKELTARVSELEQK